MDAVSIRAEKFVAQQLVVRKVEDISLLPKEIRREIRREAKRIATEDVFGVGFKTGKDDQPLEQGIGAKGNMSQHCIDAYIISQTQRNPNGPEPGYEETLARMRKDLAECDARRAAERRAAADDEED